MLRVERASTPTLSKKTRGEEESKEEVKVGKNEFIDKPKQTTYSRDFID